MKRFLAVLVSISLLATQTLFAHQAELSLWTSRRVARPTSTANVVTERFASASVSSRAPLGARLEAVLPAGLVRSRRPLAGSSGGPAVIFIQDVHRNAEAQSNIAKAISAISSAGLSSTILLEGATGNIDLSAVRAHAAPDALRRVAEFQLSRHDITGPVFAALTSSRSISLSGADDASLHAENVRAFVVTRPLLEGAVARLEASAIEVKREKGRILSADLLAFDDTVEAYHAGTLTLAAYARAMVPHAARGGQIARFLTSIELERGIDATAIERERAALVERLVEKTPVEQARVLADAAIAFRLGKLGAAEFHGQLLARASAVGIEGRFPALRAYLAYLQEADRIDGEALLQELSSAESAGYNSLARTSAEKKVCDRSRLLALSRKLVRFTLNSTEWDAYRSLADRVGRDAFLIPFEGFYTAATARNEALAMSALNASRANGNAPVILVSGGFHAGGVVPRLAAAGAAVVTLTPALRRVEGDASAYLNAFTREKTPLEKLFEGEKLFLAENPALGLRMTPALVVGVEEARDPARPLVDAASRYAAMRGFGRLSRSVDVDGGVELTVTDRGGAVNVSLEVSPAVAGAAPAVSSLGSVVAPRNLLDRIRLAYRAWSSVNVSALRWGSSVGEVLVFLTAPFVLAPVIGPAGVAVALALFVVAHPALRWILLGERESLSHSAFRAGAISVAAFAYAAIAAGISAAGLPAGDATATLILSLAHGAYIALSPSLGLPQLMILPEDEGDFVKEFRKRYPHAHGIFPAVIVAHSEELVAFAAASDRRGDDFMEAFGFFLRRFGAEWVLANWSRLAALQQANPAAFADNLEGGLVSLRAFGRGWIDNNWDTLFTVAREMRRPALVFRVASEFKDAIQGGPSLQTFRDVAAMIEGSANPDRLVEAIPNGRKLYRVLEWRQIVDFFTAAGNGVDDLATVALPRMTGSLKTGSIADKWSLFVSIAGIGGENAGRVIAEGLVPVLERMDSIEPDLLERLARGGRLIALGRWADFLFPGDFIRNWKEFIALVESAEDVTLLEDIPARLTELNEGVEFQRKFGSVSAEIFRFLRSANGWPRNRILKVFEPSTLQTLNEFPNLGTPFAAYADAMQGRTNETLGGLLKRHQAGLPDLESPRFPETGDSPAQRWMNGYLSREQLRQMSGGQDTGEFLWMLDTQNKLADLVTIGRIVGSRNLPAVWRDLDLAASGNWQIKEVATGLQEIEELAGGTPLSAIWSDIADDAIVVARSGGFEEAGVSDFLDARAESAAGRLAYLIDLLSMARPDVLLSVRQVLAKKNWFLVPARNGRIVASSEEEFLERIRNFPPSSQPISKHWQSVEKMIEKLAPTDADHFIGVIYPKMVKVFGAKGVDTNWEKFMEIFDLDPESFMSIMTDELLRERSWGSDPSELSLVVDIIRLSPTRAIPLLMLHRRIREEVDPNQLLSVLARFEAVAARQASPERFLTIHFWKPRALRDVPIEDRLRLAEGAGSEASRLFGEGVDSLASALSETFVQRHVADIVKMGIAGVNLLEFADHLAMLAVAHGGPGSSRRLEEASRWNTIVAAATSGGLRLVYDLSNLMSIANFNERIDALVRWAQYPEQLAAFVRAARTIGDFRNRGRLANEMFLFFRALPPANRAAVFDRFFTPEFVAMVYGRLTPLEDLVAIWRHAKDADTMNDIYEHHARGEFDYRGPVQPRVEETSDAPVVPMVPVIFRFDERARVAGVALTRSQESALRAAIEEVFNRPAWASKVAELDPDSSFYRAIDPEIDLSSRRIRIFVIDGLQAHIKKRAAQADGRLPQAVASHVGLVMTMRGERFIVLDREHHAGLTRSREETRLAWSRHMAWHADNPDAAKAEAGIAMPQLPERRPLPYEFSDAELDAAIERGREALFSEIPAGRPRARALAIRALERDLWLAGEHHLRREWSALRFLFERVWNVPIPLDVDDFLSLGRIELRDFLERYREGLDPRAYAIRAHQKMLAAGISELASLTSVPVTSLEEALSGLHERMGQPAPMTGPFVVSASFLRSEMLSAFPNLAERIHRDATVSLDDAREPPVVARSPNAAPLLQVIHEKLDARSARIVTGYFGIGEQEPLTQKALADEFDINPKYVHTLLFQALRELAIVFPRQLIDAFRASIPEIARAGFDAAVRRRPITLPPGRNHDLSIGEENRLLDFVDRSLTRRQRQLLPMLLRGASREAMLAVTRGDEATLGRDLLAIRSEMNEWFTFGQLRDFGRNARVRSLLTMLLTETPLQRTFRREKLSALLDIVGSDRQALKDLILELHPGEFTEAEVDDLLGGYFGELADLVTVTRSNRATAENVLSSMRDVISSLDGERAIRRRAVLRRFLRDAYYPSMRADEESGSRSGLETLDREIASAEEGTVWKELLLDTRSYYSAARLFVPRGFRNEPESGVTEPLLPAQRYGVWQALQSLENPVERSALFTSEPRVGKTIMSILAALNIRRPAEDGGGYAVSRILFTAPNISKNEAAAEFRRRVDPALGFEILVLNGPRSADRAEIARVAASGRPVAIFANYEAVRDLPDELAAFRPDAHIIDELENLRHGDDTVRAPIIFGIPATYRIGITARFIVKRGEDAVAPLLWLRPTAFPSADRLANLTDDELFAAKDPIEIRWRRRIVLPDVKDPHIITEKVPYGREQQRVVRAMRRDLPGFLANRALPAHQQKIDHVFTRIQLEQMVSIDPSIVTENFNEIPPKLERMIEIIRAERRRGGKVVVLVDFREGVDRVVRLINERLGSDDAAVGTSGLEDIPLAERNRRIEVFRSEPAPTVLVGTSLMLGSSLNLFQRRGAPFHISTMIRLSRPARNLDAGERLIGIGQTHPVVVHNLVSTFATGQGQTVEEMFEEMLAGEQAVFEHIVDGRPLIDEESSRQLESLAARMEAAVRDANADAAPSSLPYLLFLSRTENAPTVREKLLLGLGGAVLEGATLSALALAAALLPGLHWDLLLVLTVVADIAAHYALERAITNPHSTRAPPGLHAAVLGFYAVTALLLPVAPWLVLVPFLVHVGSDALRLFSRIRPSSNAKESEGLDESSDVEPLPSHEAEVAELERLAPPVEGESAGDASVRMDRFYDGVLSLVNGAGVFENASAIMPAAGLDAFPAYFVPLIAIDRTRLYDTPIRFSALGLGRPEEVYRRNYRLVVDRADDPARYESFLAGRPAGEQRVVILKGAASFMLREEEQLRTYLAALDRFLRPGDKVLILHANDRLRTAEFFTRGAYRSLDLGLSAQERQRLNKALELMETRSGNYLKAHERMLMGTTYLAPSALVVYEKVAGDGAPDVAARAFARTLAAARSDAPRTRDILEIIHGTPASLGLERLMKDGVSFDTFTDAQARAFDEAVTRELAAVGRPIRPAAALEAAIGVAGAMTPAVPATRATAERNVFLPVGDDNAEAAIRRQLAGLGEDQLLVAAVNSAATRRRLEAVFASDKRVSIMSAEETGAAAVVDGSVINPVSVEAIFSSLAADNRSGWIAVRTAGLTFAGGADMLNALQRMGLDWLIMSTDLSGTVLSTRAVELSIRAALLAMKSA